MSSSDMWQPEQPSSQTVATRGLLARVDAAPADP
jgi:hypothetical protein